MPPSTMLPANRGSRAYYAILSMAAVCTQFPDLSTVMYIWSHLIFYRNITKNWCCSMGLLPRFQIRRAIASGATPLAAYRTASWSAATHAQLFDRGLIAPGRRADIVLLSDLEKCSIEAVFVQGKALDELPEKSLAVPPELLDTVKRTPVTGDVFAVHSKNAATPVIAVRNGSLITEKMLCDLEVKNGEKSVDLKQDIVKAAVLERYGKNNNTGLAFLHGTGLKSGAIASTVAHDSHNICVIGASDADMAAAVNALIAMQGGQVVVKDGKVIAAVAFPIAGLFSDLSSEELNLRLENLLQAAQSTGCTLDDPFQQLSFLALPVIPHLKLTDKGLFDVDIFQHIEQA